MKGYLRELLEGGSAQTELLHERLPRRERKVTIKSTASRRD